MIFFVLIKNLSETDESLKLLLFFFCGEKLRRGGENKRLQRKSVGAEERAAHTAGVAAERGLAGTGHVPSLWRLSSQRLRHHRRPRRHLSPDHLQRPVRRPRN